MRLLADVAASAASSVQPVEGPKRYRADSFEDIDELQKMLGYKHLELTKNSPVAVVKIHKLGEFGLIATQHIKPGKKICSYLGQLDGDVAMQEANDRYLIALNTVSELNAADPERKIYYVDASDMGNEARFANGASHKAGFPNAEFVVTAESDAKKRNVLIRATRHIPKGAQILVDYGDLFLQGKVGFITLNPWDTDLSLKRYCLKNVKHYGVWESLTSEDRSLLGLQVKTVLQVPCIFDKWYKCFSDEKFAYRVSLPIVETHSDGSFLSQQAGFTIKGAGNT